MGISQKDSQDKMKPGGPVFRVSFRKVGFTQTAFISVRGEALFGMFKAANNGPWTAEFEGQTKTDENPFKVASSLLQQLV